MNPSDDPRQRRQRSQRTQHAQRTARVEQQARGAERRAYRAHESERQLADANARTSRRTQQHGSQRAPERRQTQERSSKRAPVKGQDHRSSQRAPERSQTQRSFRRAPERGGYSQRQKRLIMRMRSFGCAAFGIIMGLGLVIGLAAFARPATSDLEKRELTSFPELTLQSFLDGAFFSDLSLWYSDTYPLREPMVAADRFMRTLYGMQPDTMLVGGSMAQQEIPDASSGTDSETTSNGQNAPTYQAVEPPSEQAVQAAIQDNIMSGLYVKNGAAYSRYFFDQESVDTYCAAIAKAAERLKGKAKVYSVLIPTNAAAILSEDELAALGGANQQQALQYFYSKMGSDVNVVETLDALRNHNDEYIYFRTDHHWTQLGAYYAYEQLCKAMGIEPVPLEGKEKMTFQPFLGTFYNELNVPAMADNPDYVDAYIPNGTNDLTYTSHDGIEGNQGHVITDVTGWNSASLYNTFIVADQPYEEIHNPDITDGSSCLVVKDSYGCAFVPLLVDNFEYVYVMDFRYVNKNIVEFVEANDVQNVVFLNNISIAGTIGVATTLMSLVS